MFKSPYLLVGCHLLAKLKHLTASGFEASKFQRSPLHPAVLWCSFMRTHHLSNLSGFNQPFRPLVESPQVRMPCPATASITGYSDCSFQKQLLKA